MIFPLSLRFHCVHISANPNRCHLQFNWKRILILKQLHYFIFKFQEMDSEMTVNNTSQQRNLLKRQVYFRYRKINGTETFLIIYFLDLKKLNLFFFGDIIHLTLFSFDGLIFTFNISILWFNYYNFCTFNLTFDHSVRFAVWPSILCFPLSEFFN